MASFAPIAPDKAALTWIALFEGLTLLWAINPHGVTWREQAEVAIHLLLNGLRLQ